MFAVDGNHVYETVQVSGSIHPGAPRAPPNLFILALISPLLSLTEQDTSIRVTRER